MDTPLYVRIRGRVLGPYDEEKLSQMARRGQLSRLHELSPDGVNWSPASKYPEIFAGAAAEIRAPAASESAGRAGEPAIAPFSPPDGRGGAGVEAVWHYSKDGVQGTCVGIAGLQQNIMAGVIGPDDPVWTSGMANWEAARNVPGLTFPQLESRRHSTDGRAERDRGDGSDTLPREVVKTAVESRPWVFFLAICAFAYAALSALGGMLLLVQGASVHVAPVVASGLFALVYAVIAATGGVLLITHATHLGKLSYAHSPIILVRAMEAIRRFWVFTSIVLIIMLAFVLFVVIWILSIGSVL